MVKEVQVMHASILEAATAHILLQAQAVTFWVMYGNAIVEGEVQTSTLPFFCTKTLEANQCRFAKGLGCNEPDRCDLPYNKHPAKDDE